MVMKPGILREVWFTRWIRAVRIKDDHAFEEALTYDTPYLLLDAFRPDAYGGTGHRLNSGHRARFCHCEPGSQNHIWQVG